MHRSEFAPDVLGCAARLLVDLEATSLCGFNEAWLAERSCQSLEELLIRGRNAVVDLISRSPKRVAASLWQVD